jgi:hypothetical protein
MAGARKMFYLGLFALHSAAAQQFPIVGVRMAPRVGQLPCFATVLRELVVRVPCPVLRRLGMSCANSSL